MGYIDFMVGETLETEDGDFIQDLAEPQNAGDIIVAGKGNYFTSPLVGVGIHSQINSEYQLVERTALIREEMKRDGFTIASFTHFKDGEGNFVTDLRAIK